MVYVQSSIKNQQNKKYKQNSKKPIRLTLEISSSLTSCPYIIMNKWPLSDLLTLSSLPVAKMKINSVGQLTFYII